MWEEIECTNLSGYFPVELGYKRHKISHQDMLDSNISKAETESNQARVYLWKVLTRFLPGATPSIKPKFSHGKVHLWCTFKHWRRHLLGIAELVEASEA